MIRTTLSFLRGEVQPRWREIVTESEVWVAVSIAIAAALWADRLDVGDSSVGDVMTIVLAYAAVAFGFCLAGLTVAMTLPDGNFAVRLAQRDERLQKSSWRKKRPDGFVENAYARLLFVFSWTAFLHWMAIVAAFTTLVVRGYDARFLPANACFPTRLLCGILVFFLVYAAAQFLVTLITLSQVGNAYIRDLRKRPNPDGDAGSQREEQRAGTRPPSH